MKPVDAGVPYQEDVVRGEKSEGGWHQRGQADGWIDRRQPPPPSGPGPPPVLPFLRPPPPAFGFLLVSASRRSSLLALISVIRLWSALYGKGLSLLRARGAYVRSSILKLSYNNGLIQFPNVPELSVQLDSELFIFLLSRSYSIDSFLKNVG